MRHPLIAAATLAAALLAPALAVGQTTLEAVNQLSNLSMNVSIFNQNDTLKWQPCASAVVGTVSSISIDKSSGTCSGYDRIQVRVSAFNVSNKPDCWAYDMPWGSQVTISGNDSSIQCTRTR